MILLGVVPNDKSYDRLPPVASTTERNSCQQALSGILLTSKTMTIGYVSLHPDPRGGVDRLYLQPLRPPEEHDARGLSGVEVQLKRRHDLIPLLAANVKTYRDYEAAVLETVTRAQCVSQNRATSQNQPGRDGRHAVARTLRWPRPIPTSRRAATSSSSTRL